MVPLVPSTFLLSTQLATFLLVSQVYSIDIPFQRGFQFTYFMIVAAILAETQYSSPLHTWWLTYCMWPMVWKKLTRTPPPLSVMAFHLVLSPTVRWCGVEGLAGHQSMSVLQRRLTLLMRTLPSFAPFPHCFFLSFTLPLSSSLHPSSFPHSLFLWPSTPLPFASLSLSLYIYAHIQ